MKSTRLFIVLAVLAVSAGVVVSLAVLRSGRLPTDEEQKQMDALADWSFVFEGTTNRIKKTRTISAFDGQHEMVPYLRILSPYFEQEQAIKNRPVDVVIRDDQVIVVTWPVPLEIEKLLWRADFTLRVLVDRKRMVVLDVYGG